MKYITIDWLCWGLTTRQPLRVILCRLPEKGRKDIEERVEEMKERKKEEQEWKWINRRNKNIPPLPLPTTRITMTCLMLFFKNYKLHRIHQENTPI